MAPLAEKVFGGDKEKLSRFLTDNMKFINTHPNLVVFLIGLMMSLEEGADPVVKVLSDAYNPEGRLTVTFQQISAQCRVYYGTMTGLGCINIKQQPEESVMQLLYPFGYGLSYSDFRIDKYKCDEAVETGKLFKLSFELANVSNRKGKATVQILPNLSAQVSIVQSRN